MSPLSRFARSCAIAARTSLGLLAAVAAIFAVATAAPYGSTTASAATGTNAAKYYGMWNYDQPDAATLNNIDVLACPDGGGQCDPQLPLPLQVPQVGWVVFSPGPGGTVNGQTDGGCTWNFRVQRTGLELSSTTQECTNRAVGSPGNITKWSVQVKGDHETESIVTVSHQPNGVDLIGTMSSGSRTKVTGGRHNGRFVQRFLGDYDYDPADFRTLTNVVSTDKGTVYPEQGTVRFSGTRHDRGKINAHTPDGCDWTLVVRGNTAELDPDTQTCHTANGDRSLYYWALVTDDGQHINGFLAGSTTAPGQPPTNTFLYVGALTRSATDPERFTTPTMSARPGH
ncbi:hypothetical protein FH608_000515 [Nonomuraea phyllanthi]|uniref:Uncharacterized protein n=1 Tax=Nonomuraea phyllanthi TaxID=2219224 RepID=A0A5C4WW76_9ACTN|nr:hypothetical protein [Nonomuraea phyllanthi]KAB8197095.1 hypothetical protein FH608_000515 [Nonomuraea phyllanthi]QFY06903.1 hypothetical protein GBF35_09525 [Nonomuraea phyllanthi]